MNDRTAGPWKWHSRVEDLYGDGPIQSGSIFAEPIKGHAYSVAVAPKYQTEEQWRADAAAIVLWENNFDDLVKALESFIAVTHEHGTMDDGCFYYAGRSAPELQQQIESACAALAKAKGSAT
jgi:hypothetical protein